mgnify:CR=1 FL=1|jgi:hypothetical protein
MAIDKITTPAVTDANITTAKITNLNVTSGKIADDAITLAKMAPGTDGNIISYDASGNPVAVATGSSGQVLTSAGAGAVPSFQASAVGGKILQVVQGTDTNFRTTTSGSYADLTLNASITPASSSNKILVIVAAAFGIDGSGNAYFDIQKSINGGSYSSLGGGDGFGERINNNGFAPGALMTLNGAGTTDAINYKIFGKQSGGVTAKLGAGGYSVIMLLEVAA